MAEIQKDSEGPGYVNEWYAGPIEAGLGTADTKGRWRDGKSKADAVLGIARLARLIGPIYLHGDDVEFDAAWQALAEADRQRLLASTEPDRDVIDIACRLAGTTYGKAHKLMSRKAPTQQVIADLSNWRQGRNVAGMVLASAGAAGMIGEMKPIADDKGFCEAWTRLTKGDRQRLLRFEALDQDVLRVACELADSTRKDPRSRLVDTPETRAAARRKMGL